MNEEIKVKIKEESSYLIEEEFDNYFDALSNAVSAANYIKHRLVCLGLEEKCNECWVSPSDPRYYLSYDINGYMVLTISPKDINSFERYIVKNYFLELEKEIDLEKLKENILNSIENKRDCSFDTNIKGFLKQMENL